MGTYCDYAEMDSDDYTKYTWVKITGEKGDPGPAGKDGKTTYFHIKYSESPDGNPMTETPSTYIGTYVDYTAFDSNDYTDYTWSRFQGIQGPKGEQGIPGKDGDGRTSYFHIAYADSADGSVGFTITDTEGKAFMGTCCDYEINDPTEYTAYKWVRIKGDQGTAGPAGADGKTSYFHIKYSNNSDGNPMTEIPSVYIGTYVDYTAEDSDDYRKYSWSRFQGAEGEKGDQGIPGTNGTDGQTSYFHIAYAESADGSIGFSVSNSSGKSYMGTYVDFNINDSTNYRDYTWVKIQGDKGEKGPAGKDGKTTYFHIKYSPNSTGNPMSEEPNTYIGTYVDYNEVDSTIYTDYKWSRFQGAQGAKGDQGIPGTNGDDGQTSYFHIAYANSADGSVGFSVSDSTNKSYMGTYVDFVQNDSTNYRDYKWTKIKGDTGSQGPQGPQGDKGDTGNGIVTVTEYYLVSPNNTGITTSASNWNTDPSMAILSPTNKYLWNYSKTTYSTGAPTITTPKIIGVYGDTGKTGNGIKSITNYYLATNLSSGVSSTGTTGWSTDPNTQVLSAVKKYLWNYEVVEYTESTIASKSAPSIIGVYGDKGDKGDSGVGVSKIEEHYLATASSTGVTTST